MSTEDGASNQDWCPDGDVMTRDVMLGIANNPEFSVLVNNPSHKTTMDGGFEDLDDNTGMNIYGRSADEELSNSSFSDMNGSNIEPSFRVLTFKNGTDVNSIPIQKDGMAVCEKCGTIGVKHAFYSKSKRFCSLACSRSYALLQREGKPIPKPNPVFKKKLLKGQSLPSPFLNSQFPVAKVKSSKKELPVKQLDFPVKVAPTVKPSRNLTGTFTWEPYLTMENFSGALVSSFKHAPLNECWDSIMVGMKVEVENRDYGDLKELFPHSYWVASVIRVAGYKALLRYEGFALDSSEDFWLNLCKEHVQPVGWCASKGKPLIPPRSIQHKYHDWKEFLVKRLTGARTLPAEFHEKVAESLKSRFKLGFHLEVVDKNRISSTCVAYVDEVVGGRVHIQYLGDLNMSGGFWCHERSPLIHPIGWSEMSGHDICAVPSEIATKFGFRPETMKKSDILWDAFHHPRNMQTELRFKEGMKLEAVDPLNLSTVCVATVTKVLRNNYLMIGIDGYNDDGIDWFCHHSTSPSIFPAGFCELNNIDLTPPRGYKGDFKWIDYLKQTKSIAAPVSLFNRELPNHGFKVGMRLEAVDLMEPRLICVGTVTRVIGRLLRVHFDGWDVNYDQWCDCESPDLYPIGWCEMVDYYLQPPKDFDMSLDKKRKGKTSSYRGLRKKKKTKMSPLVNKKASGKLNLSYQSSESSTAGDDHLKSTDVNVPEKTVQIGVVKNSSKDDASADRPPSSVGKVTEAGADENKKTAEDSQLHSTAKAIPRLIDSISAGPTLTSYQSVITPELWSVFDVSQFLRINDCAAYCESFSKKKIDGRKFLTLTKEQIVNLTGMKVGPSLKIFELIQQLKAKVSVS